MCGLEIESWHETERMDYNESSGIPVPSSSSGDTSDYGVNHDDRDYSHYYDYDENGSYIEPNITEDYSTEDILIFKIYPFEVTILGYILPVLIILTMLTNILVVSVFMSSKNRVKATNLLFVCIAVSDSFTGLVLLPNSLYIYANEREYLSTGWCDFSMITRYYVSRVFHTVSIWQTVLLCFQRFLCVCYPFKSSQICTSRKTAVVIGVIYALAMLLHSFHLKNKKAFEHQCAWQVEDPCEESCIYMWFSTIFQHLMPVLLLCYLTARTIFSLKKTTRRVSVSSMKSMLQRTSRDKLISLTTICIVIIFLVPELPNGIYKLGLLFLMHGPKNNLQVERNRMVFAVYEIFLLISFHLNIWIYSIMMRDFRKRLISIVTLGYFRKKVERERDSSVSTLSRQGTTKYVLSRTNSDAGSKHLVFRRQVSLPSTASEINGILATATPRNFEKIELQQNLSDISNGTENPMLTETAIDRNQNGKPPFTTVVSVDSAYVSGDIGEDDVFV